MVWFMAKNTTPSGLKNRERHFPWVSPTAIRVDPFGDSVDVGCFMDKQRLARIRPWACVTRL